MKKYEMIKKLMKEEKEKIVLADVGIFYVAIGIDAYILHEILGLKLNRYAEDKYKVGVPVGSIEKYVDILNDKNIPYVIYKYDKKENLVEEYVKLYESNEIKLYFDYLGVKKEILVMLYEIKELEWNLNEKKVKRRKSMSENMLKLIPKYEDYTKYEIEIISKGGKITYFLLR